MKYAIRISSLAVLTLFFSLATVFAAPITKATVMDDSFDLASIHTIAVAAPNYVQTGNGPTVADLTAAVAQSGFDSKDLQNVTVIPYSIIASNVKKENNVDLQSTDKNTAKKLFKENAAKYADAYLVVTVANDNRVVVFYDLYSAKNDAYLYSYEVIGGGQSDNNIKSYTSFNKLFYKGLSDSIKGQHSENTDKKK
ncbi:hypothetical protein [Pectinatus cerevisiiphilus]|uniref:Uncharacterized protein n=1 Tax=Pectinatus cerevisiiphilus TaxID=86956 RepID=A0A4V2URK6_9FIRM|nr:hypothetical protein [Pectinatus cerevisiiphilus]TCS77982.1 hypothetical protein EDC37_11221 [Pectinatus cerevisiiphilus]